MASRVASSVAKAPPPSSILASASRQAARGAPWLASLWLIALTGWYVWTAADEVLHPPNEGDDLKLARLWLGLVAIVVLSHVIFPRRLITLAWLTVLASIAGVMIVASKQAIAALISAWLLVLAWTWGDWLLRRLKGQPANAPFEWVCLALTVGLTLLSIVALGLLITHRMTARWAWSILLIMTLLQWRAFLNCFKRLRRNAVAWSASGQVTAVPEQGVLLVLVGFIGLFNLTWALAPEIMFDSVNYHLGAPKVYLAEHRLVNLYYGGAA